jgi:hypothetical protein
VIKTETSKLSSGPPTKVLYKKPRQPPILPHSDLSLQFIYCIILAGRMSNQHSPPPAKMERPGTYGTSISGVKKEKDTIIGAKACKIGIEPSGRIPLVDHTCGWALGISFVHRNALEGLHLAGTSGPQLKRKINVFLLFYYYYFFSSKTLSAYWVETRSVLFRPQSLGGG